jgi:hypothetical protein
MLVNALPAMTTNANGNALRVEADVLCGLLTRVHEPSFNEMIKAAL